MNLVKIHINNFDHEDCEKPLSTYFSGIITTPVGDSSFYSVWTPVENKKVIRISKDDVNRFIIDEISKGLELSSIHVELSGNCGWTEQEIQTHWKTMVDNYTPEI
jgi:hypothetical protein